MLEDILKIENISELVKQLVKFYPRNFIQILKNKRYNNLHLLERIDSVLPMLDESYTLLTKIYWLINDLRDFPKCENDGKALIGKNIKRLATGYGKILACCNDCLNKIKYRKISNANIEKYGFANPFQFAKDSIKKTNIKKYGHEYYVQTDEFKEKSKISNIENYGTKFYQSTNEFKNRIKSTNLDKYGVCCSLHSKQAKEKTRQTSLKKYGCEDYRSSEKYKENKKIKLINKYGDDYGRILWGNNGNVGQNRRAYQFMLNSTRVSPLFTEDEYVAARKDGITEFKFECKNCHKTFFSDWDNGNTRKKCPHCQFNGGISKIEHDIFEFISSIYSGKITTNNRNIIGPLELDEYIEDMKLAIELDGLYWHNDDVKPDYRYHLNKTELCEKAGIRLIHIFDSEWQQQNDIVKSRLKNIFGIYDKKLFARKCRVCIVNKKTSNAFQCLNHLQGAAQSSIDIGLFNGTELVSLMTFSKCRFDKKHEWELVRFCSRLGYHVIGAAGKLLKYFELNYNPKSLVTYADRRWSSGGLYKVLGFSFMHNSSPNYWYFKKDSTILESRVKFQKHKLKNILEKFDENKTEVENMKDNGYHRIFDCGNMVFEKIYI